MYKYGENVEWRPRGGKTVFDVRYVQQVIRKNVDYKIESVVWSDKHQRHLVVTTNNLSRPICRATIGFYRCSVALTHTLHHVLINVSGKTANLYWYEPSFIGLF